MTFEVVDVAKNKSILLYNRLIVFRCVCFVGEITFAEFAQSVASSRKILNNIHWRPQHQICNPCYIKYDFIGRFEHLNEDAKHVLAKITASGGRASKVNITFPLINAFDGGTSLSQQLRKFYVNVSRAVVRKLIGIYKLDYELFGYDYRWACSTC